MPNDGNTSSASGEVKRKKIEIGPFWSPILSKTGIMLCIFRKDIILRNSLKKPPSKSDEK
jgi:hypothetical protein